MREVVYGRDEERVRQLNQDNRWGVAGWCEISLLISSMLKVLHSGVTKTCQQELAVSFFLSSSLLPCRWQRRRTKMGRACWQQNPRLVDCPFVKHKLWWPLIRPSSSHSFSSDALVSLSASQRAFLKWWASCDAPQCGLSIVSLDRGWK